MQVYSWVVENREVVRVLYTAVIALICLIIFGKTDKLFRLSTHQGIRYFRNAFVLFAFAFIARYFHGMRYFHFENLWYYVGLKLLFEFFIIMAGFCLFYSLFWKRFEREDAFSSLFNPRMFIFYVLALIIAVLDQVWATYNFMFMSQIVLFSFVSGASLVKYADSEGKSGFLRLYLIVIMMTLTAWLMNFAVATFFSWSKGGLIGVYALNIIIFLLFLHAVTRATKK